MKLTAKLMSILVLGTILLLALDGYILVKREIALFEDDMKLKAHLLGYALKGVFSDTWHTEGQANALKLLADTDAQESVVKIRWIWLDGSEGQAFESQFRGDRSESEIAFSTVARDTHGQEVLYTYFPVQVEENRRGVLEVAESLQRRDRFIRRTVFRTFLLSGAMIFIGGLAAVFLGIRMIGRPLHALTERARQVGKGDFSGNLILRGSNELAELANAFESMCDQLVISQEKLQVETEARIEALKQLRQADRLRTIGRLASGIAHELGTPLNVIMGRAGLIASRDLPDDGIVENAGIIKGQAERMTAIIRQLLDFARHRTPQRACVDLRPLIRQTVDFLGPLAKKQKVRLTVNAENSPVEAEVDVGQMQQIFSNLLVNALQATTEKGNVEIGIGLREVHPQQDQSETAGEYVCVRVQDYGIGISEENIEHIFEPFFTTKDIGEGTGLGLAIAYGLVSEHGGWIEVQSTPGKGSKFDVYLPQRSQ